MIGYYVSENDTRTSLNFLQLSKGCISYWHIFDPEKIKISKLQPKTMYVSERSVLLLERFNYGISMNITLIHPLKFTRNLMALWYDLGLGHRRSPVRILPPAVIFFFYTRNKHSLVGHLSIYIP